MIGFEAYDSQGPGIFLTRLKTALERRGRFSAEEPDVWIQLSFQDLPEWVRARRQTGGTKVLVRMDGAYCNRHQWLRKPVSLALPLADDWYSARVNRKKNRRIRENLLAADGIVYQSRFSRALTQRFVTPTEPGVIIYNGIDLSAFHPNGPKSAIRVEGCVNILISHSFQPYHRLHDAFRILAQLKEQADARFHLHVLGGDKGGCFPYAQSVADGLGLCAGEDYTIHGKKPHTELASIYRACDLMLNLSYWDACPNVVIEALASGLPVVGVDHGGVAELVGDSGGILVNENIPFTWIDHLNPERMPKAPVACYTRAILRMSGMLGAASAQARLRATRHFDIERACEEYLAIADELNINSISQTASQTAC